MSQAQLEIVITDTGQSAVGSPAPGVDSDPGSSASAAAASSASNVGSAPAGKDEKKPEPMALEDAMGILSRTLGFGQIWQAGELLTRAFHELTLVTTAQTHAEENKSTDKPLKYKTAEDEAKDTVKKAKKGFGGLSEDHNLFPVEEVKDPKAPPFALTENHNLFPVEAVGGLPTASAEAAGVSAAATGGIAGTASAIASMAAPVALATAAVVGLGYAAKKLGDAFFAQAEELGQFSAKLSLATSQAEVRSQYAQIERAGRLEDKLGEFVDVQSKMNVDFSRIWTGIEEILLDIFVPVMEALHPFLKLAGDALIVIADGVGIIVSIMTLHLPTAWELLKRLVGDCAKFLKDIATVGMDDDDFSTMADPFTDGVMGAGLGGAFNFDKDAKPGDFIPGGKVGAIHGGI